MSVRVRVCVRACACVRACVCLASVAADSKSVSFHERNKVTALGAVIPLQRYSSISSNWNQRGVESWRGGGGRAAHIAVGLFKMALKKKERREPDTFAFLVKRTPCEIKRCIRYQGEEISTME